jgi:DNA-binding CsgD family transcriptional regulator
VLSQRKLYGEPDIIQVRKTFGEDSKKAKLWEEKVLRRMNVVKDPKWLNQSHDSSFRGQDSSWNEGLTKLTCPSLYQAGLNISKALKGKPKSENAKNSMKKSAQKNKQMNSWNQLQKHSDCYSKYKSYEEFIADILNAYEASWRLPLIISKKLNVTEKGVVTALRHLGLSYTRDQKITKVYSKYSHLFSSYEDYIIKIMTLHCKNYSPNQIAKILKINSWGVITLLKSLYMKANVSKPGPSKIVFQEILNTDTLEMMSTVQTFENNTLPPDILIKLREAICH